LGIIVEFFLLKKLHKIDPLSFTLKLNSDFFILGKKFSVILKLSFILSLIFSTFLAKIK